MTKFEIQQVNLQDIELSDRCYIFTFEPLIANMVASLRHIGLQNPPLLQALPDQRLRIVSGLRRIIALKHLQISRFPATVALPPTEKASEQLFLINLHENLATRRLNLIEKATIIHKLISDFNYSRELVAEQILAQLKLGSNPKMIDRMLPLINLEDRLKIAIIEESLSVDSALDLIALPEEERAYLVKLFLRFKFGKNKQREFLQLIKDVSAASEQPISSILSRAEFQDILNNKTLTAPVIISRLKQQLLEWRYPQFSQVQANFERIKRCPSMSYPNSVHPPRVPS
ncbi:MAG: ParB/RepB/Spo0J family partition protein, partial [bacterium]|nr:ParB/RepB/Spo0J family partition protein [bacterium]